LKDFVLPVYQEHRSLHHVLRKPYGPERKKKEQFFLMKKEDPFVKKQNFV